VNVLKRPVLNNIGRFVSQQFKNISVVDNYYLFIDSEIVILHFLKKTKYDAEKVG